MLQGEINVVSVVDKYTQFEVVLPYQEINSEAPKVPAGLPRQIEMPQELNKPTLLVIDKDKEMLWFLNEIFSADYLVYTSSDGDEARKICETKRIDLVIVNEESTMIGDDTAISFLKNNLQTKHIPLILLSSNNDLSDDTVLNESGADAYIRKPFNVDYLKKRVMLMLKNKEYLKEYFSSSLSSFELLDGQLIHQEDKQLLNQIIAIIDKNISKNDINSDLIAEELCMGKRKLYRKMKELTNSTPTDFIKNYKLELSANMLKKSNDTVQEIMYKVGFNNRAYFYKEFTKKYGVSPGKYR
jgi:AraC-like DNA-binding protein